MEGFYHEDNFPGFYTQDGVQPNWNFKKSFTEEEVMNFTNRRFSSTSICEHQTLEEDFSSTRKQPSPYLIIGFKRDLLSIQRVQNQANWFRKNQDTINFPKPGKPTSIWESCQPLQIGSNQTFLWKQGDHLNHPEDIQDDLSCTSTQEIRRIPIYFKFPYLEFLAINLQQLFPLQLRHDINTLESLLSNQELLFRGYKTKISRYKIRSSKWIQISLTASLLKTKTLGFIFVYFLSFLEY